MCVTVKSDSWKVCLVDQHNLNINNRDTFDTVIQAGCFREQQLNLRDIVLFSLFCLQMHRKV